MTIDTLTSIDNLEQEVAELQAQLRDSISSLALLDPIPRQFTALAAECAALNAASVAATSNAQAEAGHLAAARVALEQRIAQWIQEADARDNARETFMQEKLAAFEERLTQWLQEAGAHSDAQAAKMAAERASLEERVTHWQEEAGAREAQLLEQWNTFRSAAETEQNQVMRIAMTTRQELIDRATAQEKLIASLDERMEKMNASLTNMVSDLQAARREQKRLAVLLTAVAVLALGLSVAASWVTFF